MINEKIKRVDNYKVNFFNYLLNLKSLIFSTTIVNYFIIKSTFSRGKKKKEVESESNHTPIVKKKEAYIMVFNYLNLTSFLVACNRHRDGALLIISIIKAMKLATINI